MTFLLKMSAKEQIRGHYFCDFLSVFGFVSLRILYYAVLFLTVLLGLFFYGGMRSALFFGGAAALLACLKLLAECSRIQLYRRCGNLPSLQGKYFRTVLRSLLAGIALSAVKCIWSVIFFSPTLFCICSLFLLADAGLLFVESAEIVLLTGGVLSAIGGICAGVAFSRYAAVRFIYVRCGNLRLREVFRRNAAVADGGLAALFFFRLTLLPWSVLSCVPLAAFYTAPYLLRCKMNLNDMLCTQCEALREQEMHSIKIYNGKGRPAKAVPEY